MHRLDYDQIVTSDSTRMQILITGSSGLIGTALRQHWQQHTLHVVQQEVTEQQRHWGTSLRLDELPPLDCVVHLAGAGIADKRWSDSRKQTLIDSRLDTTQQLVDEILALEHKPATVLCASAIGFYGDRGNELLDETSGPNGSFSSQLCQRWESCCQPLRDAGIRVIHLRFGIVLSNKGGALAKMLPAFKAGGGGKIGNGLQWMSWITMSDLLAAIDFVLEHSSITTAVNITAPEPVQNHLFAKALAKQLNRPCFLPMPAPMVKILFGQMGEELLLGSARVQPQVLQQHGFQFSHSTIEDALAHTLEP